MANPMENSDMQGYAGNRDEGRFREDVQYMKSQYLPMSIEILAYVNEECDMMEYDGSLMFDEYPDKTGVERVMRRIYQKAKYLENMYAPVLEENEMMEPGPHCSSCRGTESWLENLIWVILLNEMNYRRRRYFRRRGRR